MPTKLAIADDHEIFRKGFRVLLRNEENIEIVGEASNGQELIDIVSKTNPDVVITDIMMPVLDGIEATKILTKKFPALPVLGLSVFNDESRLFEMITAGARGYLLKNTTKAQLLEAIKAVLQGSVYFDNLTIEVLTKLVTKHHSNNNPAKTPIHFSDREIVIIQMICQEFSNKEIAHDLNLSIRTIENYREMIQEKTGAKNMVGIAMYAIKNGLYKP